MTAITTNPVDWILAVLFGIPCLIVAVCWIAIWVEERSESASDTSGGRATRPFGVPEGLPESEARRGRR